MDQDFMSAYQALEARMKVLADSDGDVFLPNPRPKRPVDYVLICMEPSLGRWARNQDEANSMVEAGFRNFLSSLEDFILHFCTRHYLCGADEDYHITDLSKGAMLVQHAGVARIERYNRWYSLLKEELDLVSSAGVGIVAVGNMVAEQLERRGFSRPFTRVVHYSGQAAKAREAGIEGRERNFEAFKASLSLDDVIANAGAVLRRSGVPSGMQSETLARLAKPSLPI